jgi:hypothetical protein
MESVIPVTGALSSPWLKTNCLSSGVSIVPVFNCGTTIQADWTPAEAFSARSSRYWLGERISTYYRTFSKNGLTEAVS